MAKTPETDADITDETTTADVPDHDPKVIETFEERKVRYLAELRSGREGGEHKQESLIDFLRDKLDELRRRNIESHKTHLRNIDQTCKYLAGEQYGRWDDQGNYEPYQPLPNEVAYCLPDIIGHFLQALMMLLKINLAYQCNARDQSNPAHIALADMCEKLGMEDYNRLMDEGARVDEAVNALTAGENYRCLLWGIHNNPKMVDKAKYEEAGFATPASTVCGACDMPNPEDAVQCAECGSDFLKKVAPMQQKKQVFAGVEQVPVGQNILHIPHMTAVKSDASAKEMRDATYVIETDYLPNKDVAQWLYQCLIEEGDGQSEAVRLQREQQGASIQLGQQVGVWRDRADRETGDGQPGVAIERNTVWMEVSEYGYKTFPEDQQLPNGDVLPKDTLMGERYPNGFKFCLVGKTCVNGDIGNKKQTWFRLLYGVRPGSSRGMGIQIYIPIQDLTNNAINLDITILMSSVPFRAMVKSYVDKLPQAGEGLYLNKIPPGGIEAVVKQFPAQTPSGAVGAMREEIQQAGQFILGTQSVVGRVGDPSQKALGTAHGVAAVVEQQNGRFVTPTTQRVGCDKEFLNAIICNIQTAARRGNDPEANDPSGKALLKELQRRFGPDTVEDFLAANFGHVLYWDVVNGTDKPRSDALTSAVMTEFGSLASEMMERLPNTPWVSEFLTTLGDLAGIPFKMIPGGSDRQEATRRLRKLAAIEAEVQKKNPTALQNEIDTAEKMFEVLQEFIGPMSVEAAMEQARKHGDDSGVNGAIPFLYMQDHQTFMDVYKDEYFSEDAQMFSPARKACIAMMFGTHVEALVAAENLKAEFTGGLQKKLAPGAEKKEPPTGLAKIMETMSYKDVPEDIRRQMEAAAGFTPSQIGAELEGEPPPDPNEEHLKTVDGKVIDHHLSEQAKNEQLKRDLIKDSHKAEVEVAAHEGKESATARINPRPQPKPAASNGSKAGKK